jgi:AI-2 transport protein TqsA
MDTKRPSLTSGLVAVAAVMIIFWGVRSLAFILAPLLMAMVITIAILPLPGWLAKKGVKPGLALILTILAVVGVLGATCLLVIASLGKLAGLLPSYTASMAAQPVPLTSSVAATGTAPALESSPAVTTTSPIQAIEAATGLSLSSLQSLASPAQVSGVASAVIIAAGKMIGQVFFVLFIFAFMLSAALGLRGQTIAGFGADNPNVQRFQEFTLEVRQYVSIMTVINLLVAVGNTVFLLLLGIPFALLWGVLSFVMGFIPSIGWWISLIPPFFLAWSLYGIGTALIVLGAYVLINGGVQNIVQPRMMGKGLRMSPLVVFVSVIVWATILGGMGALIAVPMTLIVMKILDSYEGTRWIAVLMRVGSETEPGEDQQAFERLKGLGGRLRDAIPFGARQEEKPAES